MLTRLSTFLSSRAVFRSRPGKGLTLALTAVALTCVLPAAEAEVLTASPTSNNSGGGISFDIEASGSLNLTGLDLDIYTAPYATGPTKVSVYWRPGTWVGFAQSPDGWNLANTFDFTGSVSNVPDFLDLTGLLVGPGITGLYIAVENGGVRYANGATNYSNSDLTIYSGAGRATGAPFAENPISSRTFSGAVHYTVPEPGSVLLVAMALALAAAVARKREPL